MDLLLPTNFFRILIYLHLLLLLAALVQIYRCRESLLHKIMLLLIAGMLPIIGSLIVLATAPAKNH